MEERYMEIAEEIYNQIGGHRFIVMTGCNNWYTIKNGLCMRIPRNKSKANMIEIILNGKDLYDVSFYKFVMPGKNNNYLGKKDLIKEYNDVYCDNLETIFQFETGLYTRF